MIPDMGQQKRMPILKLRSMIDYLRRSTTCQKCKTRYQETDKELFDFYEKNQRLPSYDELAEMMNLSVEEVKEYTMI